MLRHYCRVGYRLVSIHSQIMLFTDDLKLPYGKKLHAVYLVFYMPKL